MKNMLLALGALVLAASSGVHAASFDCAKASTLIENAVCTNPELSRKDEVLGRLYQAVLKQDPAVRAEQISWLRERNRCVDERCLMNAYDRRIEALRVVSAAGAPAPNGSAQPDMRRDAPDRAVVETKPAPSPVAAADRSMKDPAQAARTLQMPGVSRCIAATVIMSAGLVQDPKIKANGPEIRNNNQLMGFYGDARKQLIRSMNNPAAEGAIDNMVRQQGEYFGNLVKFQGWAAFMPEYKQCRDGAYQ